MRLIAFIVFYLKATNFVCSFHLFLSSSYLGLTNDIREVSESCDNKVNENNRSQLCQTSFPLIDPNSAQIIFNLHQTQASDPPKQGKKSILTPSELSYHQNSSVNERCSCNGYSNLCRLDENNSDDIVCENCSANTTGNHCELCLTGFVKIFSKQHHQDFICIFLTNQQSFENESVSVNIENISPNEFPTVGSNFRLMCKFNLNNQHLHAQESIQFNLTWTRKLLNKSETTLVVKSNVTNVRHEDGFELVLTNVQLEDSGNYHCSAINVTDATIISEAHLKLVIRPKQEEGEQVTIRNETAQDDENNTDILYSQENLSKLLPSLRIVPNFQEVDSGQQVQFICVTDLEPKPKHSNIDWIFQPFGKATNIQERQESFPSNTTSFGQNLMIWLVNESHEGIYKCIYTDSVLNLSAEASGGLLIRDTSESAPLVVVKPQLLQLSPNGSATIDCEATGYPPPALTWLRTESPTSDSKSFGDYQKIYSDYLDDSPPRVNTFGANQSFSASIIVEGIEFENFSYLEVVQFCYNQLQSGSSNELCQSDNGKTRVTRISKLHISGALAVHQGQYVCRADNKHGSNQAYATVDVEFKVKPQVTLSTKTTQTIDLTHQDVGSANFTCTILAGRPKPKLRWLRVMSGGVHHRSTGRQHSGTLMDSLGNLNSVQFIDGSRNTTLPHIFNRQLLDNGKATIYDLSRETSATSRVYMHADEAGSSLTLSITTGSYSDEGDYVCVGDNELGRHSVSAHLQVIRSAHVKVAQQSPFVANFNESFQLECVSFGHPMPLDIEWSRHDLGAFFSLISRQGASQERAVLHFDKVRQDEAGEYTCNARDPISGAILRDTVMLVVEASTSDDSNQTSQTRDSSQQKNGHMLPQLIIRPSKIIAKLGSNVTLDCLAIAGLQPTVIEWLAPVSHLSASVMSSNATIEVKSYYKSSLDPSFNLIAQNDASSLAGQIYQFGSKLRITNLSKDHEGVYQCKGRNRAGVENAPALVKVRDDGFQVAEDLASFLAPSQQQNSDGIDKTKVAISGSNIELKCQVTGKSGIERLATSWSREGQGLPVSSVQIGHDLWIQNVTKQDAGLYVCFLRSSEPNHIIQAKINLSVKDSTEEDDYYGSSVGGILSINNTNNHYHKNKPLYNAKIVASKQYLNIGDSVTLECIVQKGNDSTKVPLPDDNEATRLEDIEKSVVWSNLNNGHSLFQDNVFVQDNLLIIYDLRLKNSADYRCNFNDLRQHIEYQLQVFDPNSKSPYSDTVDNSSSLPIEGKIDILRAVAGSKVVVECPLNGRCLILADSLQQLDLISHGTNFTMSINQLESHSNTIDAGQITSFWWLKGSSKVRLNVKPKSPLFFNAISLADADLYTCQGSFQGMKGSIKYFQASVMLSVNPVAAMFSQNPASFITMPSITGAYHQLDIEIKFNAQKDSGMILFNGQTNAKFGSGADFVSLGVNNGFVEFRFELGDGVTLVRSKNKIELNKWHKIVIERNRTLASMWIDKHEPVSNSSPGKFFNLDLDSVLYVGGHQFFLSQHQIVQNQSSLPSAQKFFYGFSSGFSGCISELRILKKQLDLLDNKRSVSVGVFECSMSECDNSDCDKSSSICQVVSRHKPPLELDTQLPLNQRCICLNGFSGEKCDERTSSKIIAASNSSLSTTTIVQHHHRQVVAASQEELATADVVCRPNPCASGAPCQPLPASDNIGELAPTFRCNCPIGYKGEACAQPALFLNETNVYFGAGSYLQLRFNSPEQMAEFEKNASSDINSLTTHQANNLNYISLEKQASMAERQDIAFSLQTRAENAMLFYCGAGFYTDSGSMFGSTISRNRQQQQQSPLAKLANVVFDFFVVLLVDGRVEVSYELGSGVASLKSATRINDGREHRVRVQRVGKTCKLSVDDKLVAETVSPGKLLMLNTLADFYVGGLPHGGVDASQQQQSRRQPQPLQHSPQIQSLIGCVSQLEVNGFGPINLVRSEFATQVRGGQNLLPCTPKFSSSNQSQDVLSGGSSLSAGGGLSDDGDET